MPWAQVVSPFRASKYKGFAIFICCLIKEVGGRGIGTSETPDAEDRTVQIIEPIAKKKADEKEATGTEDDVSGDEELESGKFPYLYAAVRVCNKLSVPIDDKNRYQLPLSSSGQKVGVGDRDSVAAALGRVYWALVKQACWKRIKDINSARLRKMNVEPPNEWLY